MIIAGEVFNDRHLPRTLIHREAEVETLLTALRPSNTNADGGDVLITGPSGVGKTVLARHTLDRAEREVGTTWAYVRCLGATPRGVLGQILEDHPGGDPVADDASVEVREAALRAAVDEPLVVILDEAEGLPNVAVLRRLGQIPALSTVVICHDPHEWLARLSVEVDRYVDADIVRLDRYGVTELADILEARAEVGLRDGVVDRDQLERIADETAGVARNGIQALRAAAEHADDRGGTTITDADVDASFEQARRYIRQQNVRSLALHHHVLYALIYEAGEITGSALHDRYDAVAEQAYAGTALTPIVRRTRRNQLRKLQEYDLVAAEGTGTGRTYAVVDETIEPPISLAVQA